MSNGASSKLTNPLARFLNTISPEFQQGRRESQQFQQQSRLNDLAIQERELGIAQARQQQQQNESARQAEAVKNASEQDISNMRLGNRLAKALKEIPNHQQRTEILQFQAPILMNLGFDRDDIASIFDPDPQIMDQKLDRMIQASDVFLEQAEQVLKPGESIVRDGQIQLTAPFKPERPSRVESQLRAEGLSLGTPEAQARARELGDRSGVNIQIGEEREQKKNQQAFNVFQTAFQNLSESLAGTATGPIMGLLPAITSEGQIAEGAIAAMAPILKQIFRTAGEGTFTDKDQELLLAMVPTRKDTAEARKAKIENIDAIVKAKLGITQQGQGQQQDFDFEYDPETGTFK